MKKQVFFARKSTASVGKFESTVKGEKLPKLGKRRKFASNFAGTSDERSRQLDILTKLQQKKPTLTQSRFNAVYEQSANYK